MKIKFTGDTYELKTGINILAGELGFTEDDEGLPVHVEKSDGNIEVLLHAGKGIIRYNRKVHFFRALGLFIEALRNSYSFNIIETPQFDNVGVMFDVSRNSVMKPENIKNMIRKLAIMGITIIIIYMEDVFTVEGEPYFGYMRGRYSYRELKECDDYADVFGIEMIPAIQTMAHLESFLKWDAAAIYKDTADAVLVGSAKTYELIDKLIKNASAPFRSKRIHMGMDEAHSLGRGRYLDMYGYRNKTEIMIEHIRKVTEITSKYGLRPMMWSDMCFKCGSKKGDYYDPEANIPESLICQFPREMQLVYWDYDHGTNKEFCKELIRKHKVMGRAPIFAGAVWTFMGMGTNYGITLKSSDGSLEACKEEGVREVFVCTWFDDGAENNFYSALLGFQLYAEHGYSVKVDTGKLKRRFEFCTGMNYEAFINLKYLDETPGVSACNLEFANPSKYLLWQDILMGLFDKHIEGINLSEHYKWLRNKIKENRKAGHEFDFIFDVPEKLCSVLEIKAELGIKIKEAYDKKDSTCLRRIAREQLPELSRRIRELRDAHRDQWFKINKPFGWEVLDIRYGGLSYRVDSVIKRLVDYLEGRIERIEELEEERLYFDGPERDEGIGLGRYKQYWRIVTANYYSQ